MDREETLPRESAEELYDGAPCGYLSTALDGTIAHVNRTFLEWTGHEESDLVGRRRFDELLTPGGRIYHETHFAPLLRMQGAVREIAVEVVRRDGSRLPALVNAVVRESAAGEQVVRMTVFDATDRRRYEEELRRSRDRERAARRRVERLQRLADALAEAPLDRAAMADAAARELAAQTGADRVLLAQLGETGRLRVIADRGSWRGLITIGPDGSLEASSSAGVAVATREPLFADDGGGGTLAFVPMLGGTRPTGLLALHLTGPAVPGAEDREVLVACGRQCAHALEHARLYEEERNVADTLQRSLLADPPPGDGRFRVATHYSPGVDSLEVGGDWFDIFRLGGDRLAVVVGDVVGRGLAAATAMGQLRSAVRGLALADRGPAELLGHLDSFAAQTAGAQVATLVYAEIPLGEGEGRFGCAGHPPPILIEPGAEPRALWEGRSAPLGVPVPVRERAEAGLALAPGSRLFLYTDGLVERRARSFDQGLDTLLAEIGARSAAEPEELVAGLAEALGGVDDDVCMLCLEVTAPA